MGRAPSRQTPATSASRSQPVQEHNSCEREWGLLMETNHGKGIEAWFHFAQLDHDKCVDLGCSDSSKESEGGVGDDGEERGGGEANQQGQNATKNWTSLGEKKMLVLYRVFFKLTKKNMTMTCQ